MNELAPVCANNTLAPVDAAIGPPEQALTSAGVLSLAVSPPQPLFNLIDPDRHFGVYCIFNNKSGLFYIGKAALRPMRERWQNHASHIRRKHHANFKIRRDAAHFGFDSFYVFPIEYCLQEETIIAVREHYWIKKTKAVERGYNLSSGELSGFENPGSSRAHIESYWRAFGGYDSVVAFIDAAGRAGLMQKEIALELGCANGTVRSIISRESLFRKPRSKEISVDQRNKFWEPYFLGGYKEAKNFIFSKLSSGAAAKHIAKEIGLRSQKAVINVIKRERISYNKRHVKKSAGKVCSQTKLLKSWSTCKMQYDDAVKFVREQKGILTNNQLKEKLGCTQSQFAKLQRREDIPRKESPPANNNRRACNPTQLT